MVEERWDGGKPQIHAGPTDAPSTANTWITLAQGPLTFEPTRHERLKVRMLPILALEKYDKRGTSEIVYYRGSHRTWK